MQLDLNVVGLALHVILTHCYKVDLQFFLTSCLPTDCCTSLVFKQYGGHVASTFTPADMKFINMAFKASRPDGKPPVPIWITTEENVVCVHTASP